MDKTKVMVEFSISGDELNPEVVTEKLGIVPGQSWRKGDIIKGKNYPRRASNWDVSTEYEETLDIQNQLVKIYDLLKNKIEILNELRDEYNLEYQIGIVPEIYNEETPALHFDLWFIEFVHSIKAEIDIDVYVFS